MTAGQVYTVAGTGTGGYNGDGIPATSAEVRVPWGLAVDAAGNLVFSDSDNQRVRVVAEKTGTFYGQAMKAGNIYTVAGCGDACASLASGIPATTAQLIDPGAATVNGEHVDHLGRATGKRGVAQFGHGPPWAAGAARPRRRCARGPGAGCRMNRRRDRLSGPRPIPVVSSSSPTLKYSAISGCSEICTQRTGLPICAAPAITSGSARWTTSSSKSCATVSAAWLTWAVACSVVGIEQP
jgi:hypothetical protein